MCQTIDMCCYTLWQRESKYIQKWTLRWRNQKNYSLVEIKSQVWIVIAYAKTMKARTKTILWFSSVLSNNKHKINNSFVIFSSIKYCNNCNDIHRINVFSSFSKLISFYGVLDCNEF